jgi:IS5 family transposase
VESEMTEEEFRALLKVQGDEKYLKVVPEAMWTVLIVNKAGTPYLNLWATSSDKEMALETLAEKYFGGNNADS